MTVEQVREIFAVKITGDKIALNETDAITVEKFSELFADAEPTYTGLIAVDGYVDETNTGKGYKNFFDQCKAEGILL